MLSVQLDEKERSDTPVVIELTDSTTALLVDSVTTISKSDDASPCFKSQPGEQSSEVLGLGPLVPVQEYSSALDQEESEASQRNLLDTTLESGWPAEPVAEEIGDVVPGGGRLESDDDTFLPSVTEGEMAYRQCLTSDEFETSPPFCPVPSFDLGKLVALGLISRECKADCLNLTSASCF